MATSFVEKKRLIFAEARKKDAKPQLQKLAQALKNFDKLSASDKSNLKELVNALYEKFVERQQPTKKGETSEPKKKISKNIADILREFKNKIGAEKWKMATRGTDIYRDMERPALKRGKRIVRRKGKTTNQYGTFKNKVGSTYYESRTNRSDVNQPSDKRYPKLAHGGKLKKSIVNPFAYGSDEYWDRRENFETYLSSVSDTIYWNWLNESINDDEASYMAEMESGVEFNPKIKYARGGKTGKKKITRQYPNYSKEADSGLVAKPQGYRFTEKLAKRLGQKSYAKPSQAQIEKYRGKGVYSERRQDKSDVNPKSTYPSLGDGGEFGGGGKTKSILDRIKNADTISEKDINLLKRRMTANSNDESVREVLDYYNEVGYPRLDAEQTKKGYAFLMNLYKSPTGKVRSNNPFSDREIKVLEDFSHFEFYGFEDKGNSYRSFYIPIYIVVSKNGASFEYYYDGKVNVIGARGYYAGGGRTGKKKITRQYPNYSKEADSGLVAKPQGYRFTEKLAKRLREKSYAKPSQAQIEKYRGRGVYSERRQDKSDVKPKSTYPSL
ncbi:MAG: hypothetical protein EBQ89_09630 [Alphaproteobacteria bacterium]|nr:hypothetical protein [Alphaproteobacteria bacterium]